MRQSSLAGRSTTSQPAALASGCTENRAYTEADAEAIRTIFHQEGELSAAIELRRRFPGIMDNAKARACARTIAGWTARPTAPASVIPLRPRKAKAVLETPKAKPAQTP